MGIAVVSELIVVAPVAMSMAGKVPEHDREYNP
jgi:hypothetical protein